ncbi:hypothetical protein LV779_05865 [Streptomyces thinghirensis]|nr:hypothetical protein [Streptomyces thinghirensis]
MLEAIRKVLDSGAPLQVMDLTTPVEDAFVTELLHTLPAGLADHTRVRFCGPSGTDPVATAVELVRAATGRNRVVTFTGTTTGRPPGRARTTARPATPAARACPIRRTGTVRSASGVNAGPNSPPTGPSPSSTTAGRGRLPRRDDP